MNDIVGVSGDYTLNSIRIKEDKVFRSVVEAITPEKIFKENKELIDAFVDILVEESPISINIMDIFNKDKSIESLDAVQKQFAEVYLNNFYTVWNKAKTDFRLKNKIDNLLKKYSSIGIEIDRKKSFVNFFENEEEMYTSDRYMMAKTFNEKKGTEVAIEYAYKLAWLSGIEGPLRDAYFFDIQSQACLGLSEGFIICGDSLSDPLPPEPTQEEKDLFPTIWPLPDETPILCSDASASRIGTFTISDTVSHDSCTKFTYQIEGSLFPEFFEAFVIPLAHPIGFNYIYRKITSMAFEDYFNLEYIYRCDEIGVRSLCVDGDCTDTLTEIYGVRAIYDDDGKIISAGGGISKSQLKHIEKGIMIQGTYANWDYEKYIFDNDNYLIQYTYAPPLGKVEQVIKYYDINLNRSYNYVKNPSFDEWYDWQMKENTHWTISDGKASFNSYVEGGMIRSNNSLNENQEDWYYFDFPGGVIDIFMYGVDMFDTYLFLFPISEEDNLNNGNYNNSILMNDDYGNYSDARLVGNIPSGKYILIATGYVDMDASDEAGYTIYQSGVYELALGYDIGNVYNMPSYARFLTSDEIRTTFWPVLESDYDILSQPISLEKDKKYEIILKISGLSHEDKVTFRINERKVYDDNGLVTDVVYDEWLLTENIEYNLGYTGYGGEEIKIFASNIISTNFKLEYVNIFINEPSKTYNNDIDQSDIYIINLDNPILNLFTHDEMIIKTEISLNEDMNELYYNHISDEDKYPIIGKNMIINEYHYGRADVETSGYEQIVDVVKHMTVDYFMPTLGAGTIRTRYEATRDLGLRDLLYEDFTDTNNWRILVNNINYKLDIDEGITSEGAFRIGDKNSNPTGLVIPKGSDDTTYMVEELSIERDFEAEWIQGIDDISFANPSKWFMTSDWRIEEFFNTESNYAEIKPRNTIQTTGSEQLVDVQVGTLIEYIESVQGPDTDNTSPFGHKYHTYESLENRGIIDINKEDFISSPKWKKYRRTVDSYLSREIDTDTILNDEIIKLTTLIDFQYDYNDIDNWIELTIGQEGDITYRYKEDEDFWTTINIGNLVTYQKYKNGILVSENQYESVLDRGEINLKDEDFTDSNNWTLMPNADNVPDYTYKSNDNNYVTDVSVGMTVDVIQDNYWSNRERRRYISKTDRNSINLAWEDFSDENLWTEEEVNNPIRISNSTQIEWGGKYKIGDKIYFTASPTFRGKVTYFDVKVFNKKI